MVIDIFSKYKYKFYLNANHAIYIDNNLGKIHSHTWEITLIVKNFNENFMQFNDVENIINEILDKYQNKNINTLEPFDKINPTLENICKYFNDIFKNKLLEKNIRLDTIEICESPKRAFIIENDDNNTNIAEQNEIEKENENILNSILEKYKQK